MSKRPTTKCIRDILEDEIDDVLPVDPQCDIREVHVWVRRYLMLAVKQYSEWVSHTVF